MRTSFRQAVRARRGLHARRGQVAQRVAALPIARCVAAWASRRGAARTSRRCAGCDRGLPLAVAMLLVAALASCASPPARDDAAAKEAARLAALAEERRGTPPFTAVETATVHGAIVPHEAMEGDRARELGLTLPFRPDSFWTPTVEDVTHAQAALRAAMTAAAAGDVSHFISNTPAQLDFPPAPEAARDIVQNWDNYRVQFVGLVIAGHQRLWCNFFPTDQYSMSAKRWLWELVNTGEIEDGGSSFWSIQFDAADGTFLDFHVNGVA